MSGGPRWRRCVTLGTVVAPPAALFLAFVAFIVPWLLIRRNAWEDHVQPLHAGWLTLLLCGWVCAAALLWGRARSIAILRVAPANKYRPSVLRHQYVNTQLLPCHLGGSSAPGSPPGGEAEMRVMAGSEAFELATRGASTEGRRTAWR